MMYYTVEIRGKQHRWSLPVSDATAMAMKADGFEVIAVHNSMPAWVADAGLAQPWCDIQDIWNWPVRMWRKIFGVK